MGTNAINMIRETNGQPPVEGGSVLLDPDKQAFLESACDMGAARLTRMGLYEDYYDGEHRTELLDRAREYLEASNITFAENFCEPLIDAIAGRLVIEGFVAKRGTQPDEAVTELLEEWWAANRMDAVAQTVHTMALVLSEYFVFAEWEDDTPAFVGNHPRMVRAHYGDADPDQPEFVAKRWNSNERGPANPNGRTIQRLNLYYPDRIERYWTASKGERGWDIWIPEGETSWPLWWTDTGTEQGRPRGIPVAHFRNRPLGRSAGRSELRGDIPMQDLQNKLVIDLAMVLDNAAWAQRWVTGQSKQNASIQNVPGEVWFFPDKEARVGSFGAENPQGVLASIESVLSRRARRAQIPLHLLTGGDIPSGEAMRSAEAGLVKKVEARMEVFGDAWEDVMRIALQLAGVPVDDLTIETKWRSAESRDDAEQADAAVKWKDAGVSADTIMERYGFNAEEEAERRGADQGAMAGDLRSLMGGMSALERPPFPGGEE